MLKAIHFTDDGKMMRKKMRMPCFPMTSKNPTDITSFIYENNPANCIIYNYIIIYNKIIS